MALSDPLSTTKSVMYEQAANAEAISIRAIRGIRRISAYLLESRSQLTLAFSCGARSAFKLKEKGLLKKHATAPSAARLCSMPPLHKSKTVTHSALAILYFNL